MSALLTTLPGDIPGLLRRGSPVLVTVDSDRPPIAGVVWEPVWEPDEVDPRCLVQTDRGLDNKAKMFVALDLTDATGRWHAALWLDAHLQALPATVSGRAWERIEDLLEQACQGLDLTPKQIDTLARLVLRLAGRAP